LIFGRAKENDKNLDILNGLRVFAIVWVILGHTYLYMLEGPIQNATTWPFNLIDTPIMTIVMAAPYSVDIFFWLSGFLGAYLLLTGMKKKKGRIEPYYGIVLHRVLRLWPMYAATLLLFWGVVKHLGDGPIFWSFVDKFVNTCDKYWWSHLIFINNFYPGKDTDKCITWTWYLPNDFQFFLL